MSKQNTYQNAFYAALRNRFKTLFNRYKVNTLADGGTVRDDSVTKDYMKMAQDNRMSDSIKFAWLGEAGIKQSNGRVSKLYGLSDKLSANENATQPTTAKQPYLSGNIAPNEKLGIKNPNGGSNYMTHPTISFAANESWSVTTVLNFNGDYGISDLCGKISSGSKIGVTDNNGVNTLTITSNDIINSSSPIKHNKIIGKNSILSFIAIGDGSISMYLNGLLFANFKALSNRTSFIFEALGIGRDGSAYSFKGKIHSHIIRSQALTPTQVTAEYNYLRSVYPEIESVDIGTQTWATSNFEAICTPQGTLIPEMQDNTTWASSQTLYDNAYNSAFAGNGGNVTLSTYAGVKAAAMWCHYNNDVAIGAVYGKLYNWFAVKLLQMDIDYYNAANPTDLWGWRIPTQTDFQTLSTYLGGDAVSGGKLKETGYAHWNSPNAGADNSSGFCALGGTGRIETGTFPYTIGAITFYWTNQVADATQSYRAYLSSSTANTVVDVNLKSRGYSVRLIKA